MYLVRLRVNTSFRVATCIDRTRRFELFLRHCTACSTVLHPGLRSARASIDTCSAYTKILLRVIRGKNQNLFSLHYFFVLSFFRLAVAVAVGGCFLGLYLVMCTWNPGVCVTFGSSTIYCFVSLPTTVAPVVY